MEERSAERSIQDVAESLGVASSLLYKWREVYGKDVASKKNERGENMAEENARLRQENMQLRKEREVLKIRRPVHQGPPVSAVELVDQNRGALSVDRVCDLVGISPSAYYKAKRRGPSKRQRDDERLGVHVRAMFRQHRGRYGSPRLARSLTNNGCRAGRHRVARNMRENGLKARDADSSKRPRWPPGRSIRLTSSTATSLLTVRISFGLAT
ncbi:MAG: IS3 family transposase [Betaproteobacteria bacterium]|nr:IS3 family transposase [Betaproteobacteria bacterium]MBM3804538.1 IS3 family transposase [Acidimicrobiia bacterium]